MPAHRIGRGLADASRARSRPLVVVAVYALAAAAGLGLLARTDPLRVEAHPVAS